MPVTPSTPAATSQDDTDSNTGTSKTLTSKKMIVPDYPVLWWTSPKSTSTSNSKAIDRALPFVLSDCGLEYTCTFSQDRGQLSGGDRKKSKKSQTPRVVVFEGSRIDTADFPTTRDPAQAWVLHTEYDVLNDPVRTKMLAGLAFTHLWSYSLDADVIETHFLPSSPLSSPSSSVAAGSSQQATGQLAINNRDMFLEAIVSPPTVDLTEKNRLRARSKQQGGKASAVWIVDDNGWREEGVTGESKDCKDSPSGRENYVRELIKMMDIDIYGQCMNNTAWPLHSDTRQPYTAQEIISDYKFVLALEPFNCQDYVSSSLADAFVVGAIPIVDGPKDYTRFSPTNNALIRVDEFVAPELLAQEIDMLDRNDTLYLERLNYKRSSSSPTELLPAFKKTWGGSSTPPSLLPPGTELQTETERGQGADAWGLDRQGAYCGICRLARDIANNEYEWPSHTATTVEKQAVPPPMSVCESEPRYLPGLPAQMMAYEDYLEHQKEQYYQSGLGSITHSLGVKVTFDKPQYDEPSDTWIQPGEVSGNMPSVAINRPGKVLGQGTLGSGNSAITTPPSFEMFYLLILILTLCVGVIVLLLITSKSARRMCLSPWRYLLYSKVPSDDREVQSLERVMLRELGEGLIYE